MEYINAIWYLTTWGFTRIKMQDSFNFISWKSWLWLWIIMRNWLSQYECKFIILCYIILVTCMLQLQLYWRHVFKCIQTIKILPHLWLVCNEIKKFDWLMMIKWRQCIYTVSVNSLLVSTQVISLASLDINIHDGEAVCYTGCRRDWKKKM